MHQPWPNKRQWVLVIFALSLSLEVPATGQKGPSLPESRAERTDYTETSRYQDVMDFLAAMERVSDRVRVRYFGHTTENRAMPLVILADPPIYEPGAAKASDRLVVFVMANIHAGEVEGKEASLHLIRQIAAGPLQSLLDKLIILFAPIYNADGNERIKREHRPQQKGPSGGVGTRTNAQGLDLNRDYMKLESPEANALVTKIFNLWDPGLTVDLHTTNGSYHGYVLTYAPPLNPNTHPALIRYLRRTMLPEVTRRMDRSDHYKTTYYGNFIDPNQPSRGWRTFDHRPRFGNNYVGLRNRLAILSEAYAYNDFRVRIDATQTFVRTLLEYSAEHADEIREIIHQAERETINRGRSPSPTEPLGVTFRIKRGDHRVEILANKVVARTDPKTHQTTYKRTDEIVAYQAVDLGQFEAIKRRPAPRAYLLRPDQRPIVDKLMAHGITVEELTEPLKVEVEAFVVDTVEHAERLFQGHHQTTLRGSFRTRTVQFPMGSYMIPMAQVKANLAFYLLEAESDDGLVNWNLFDEALLKLGREGGSREYPVYRLQHPVRVARRVIN